MSKTYSITKIKPYKAFVISGVRAYHAQDALNKCAQAAEGGERVDWYDSGPGTLYDEVFGSLFPIGTYIVAPEGKGEAEILEITEEPPVPVAPKKLVKRVTL